MPPTASETIASTSYPLYLTSTHPHFWPLTTQTGLKQWVGKQFVSTNGRYIWVVSGPLLPGADRQVIYCEAGAANRNFCIDQYFSWERWTKLDYNLAKVQQFGGQDANSSPWRYPTFYSCQNKQFPGIIWPSLLAGQTYGYRYMYSPPGCKAGGYLAIVRDTYASKSALCSSLLSNYPVASRICQNSVQVHLVFQCYYSVFGDQTFVGCEAVIYISGFPQPVWGASETGLPMRKWFRNGELRFSAYMPIGELPPPAPTAANWWKSRALAAFQGAENFIYTGVYKLQATTYFDSGEG